MVLLRFLICALALVGLADSLYFTLAYYGRIRKAQWIPEILCAREGSACVTVVQTPYARLFGAAEVLLLGIVCWNLLIAGAMENWTFGVNLDFHFAQLFCSVWHGDIGPDRCRHSPCWGSTWFMLCAASYISTALSAILRTRSMFYFRSLDRPRFLGLRSEICPSRSLPRHGGPCDSPSVFFRLFTCIRIVPLSHARSWAGLEPSFFPPHRPMAASR